MKEKSERQDEKTSTSTVRSMGENGLTNNSYDATEKRNLKIIGESFEAWRNGTGGPYALLAENAEWTIVGNSLASKTYRSRKEFMKEVIEPFNARLTGRLVPAIKAIYADGDTVIVHFTAEGMVRDGKPYVNTYSWFLTLGKGRITSATAFFDAIAFNDLWNRVTPAK